MTAPLDEAARQSELDRYRITDSLPDPAFDDIVRVAATVCGVERALITVIDRDRQWFKAMVGLEGEGSRRDEAFCDHAIRQPDRLMEVKDATADARFAANPFVTGDPHVRFYAGMPLVTAGGAAIGALCVIDSETRSLDERQRTALAALGRVSMALFEARHQEHEAARAKLAPAPAAAPAATQAAPAATKRQPVGNNYLVAIIELQDAAAVAKRLGERTLEVRLAELQQALEKCLPEGDSVSRVSGCAELILLLRDAADAGGIKATMREAMTAFESKTQGQLLNVQVTSNTPDERVDLVFLRADEARTRAKDAQLAGRDQAA